MIAGHSEVLATSAEGDKAAAAHVGIGSGVPEDKAAATQVESGHDINNCQPQNWCRCQPMGEQLRHESKHLFSISKQGTGSALIEDD